MTTETTKPSAGAMRAAVVIERGLYDSGMYDDTPGGKPSPELREIMTTRTAEVIDRETAAPELLEACTELLDTVDYLMHNEGNADKCARISIGGAIAAIAKATGEGVE